MSSIRGSRNRDGGTRVQWWGPIVWTHAINVIQAIAELAYQDSGLDSQQPAVNKGRLGTRRITSARDTAPHDQILTKGES